MTMPTSHLRPSLTVLIVLLLVSLGMGVRPGMAQSEHAVERNVAYATASAVHGAMVSGQVERGSPFADDLYRVTVAWRGAAESRPWDGTNLTHTVASVSPGSASVMIVDAQPQQGSCTTVAMTATCAVGAPVPYAQVVRVDITVRFSADATAFELIADNGLGLTYPLTIYLNEPDGGPQLLANPGFETDTQTAWVVKGERGKRVCNKLDRPGKPDKIVAYDGACAYRLKAASDRLKQKVTPVGISAGDVMWYSLHASGKKLADGARLKVKVVMMDGSQHKHTMRLADATYDYRQVFGQSFAHDEVRKVVFLVKNAPGGKLTVDALRLVAVKASN